MVRLLNESDDFPRPLTGADSHQIDTRARAKYRAQRITGGDARSGWRSIDSPIRPIPPPSNDNIVRGVHDLGGFEREARRGVSKMSFARGDMTRKQCSPVRFEHVQRRPRPRVDLYEPDSVG